MVRSLVYENDRFVPYFFYLDLQVSDTLLDVDTWTYLPFKVVYNDKPSFFNIPTGDIYDFDITDIIQDKKWHWFFEVAPSHAVFKRDALGDRGFEVQCLIYDQTPDRALWDTEFGVFSRFTPFIARNYDRAAGSDTTFLTLAGNIYDEFLFENNGVPLGEKERACINLVAYQRSSVPVNIMSASVNLKFTRHLRKI